MRTSLVLPAALRSGPFRFAFALSLVFAAGAALLLWVVARQVNGYASQATEAMLRSEVTILSGEYNDLGYSGMTDAMERHAAIKPEAPYRYLLVDRRGQRLFGDLPRSSAHVGWGSFDDREPGGEIVEVRHLGAVLPDGLILVVGTDTFDIATMRQRLLWFTLSSGVGISLFALFGGLLAGRHFTRRLERVNHTVDRIIDGNLDERIPAIGVGPEIDALIRNLNRMLERKAAAMEGLRQVSTAIAHDLRTPLMRLRQRLETLQETKDPKPVLIDGAVGQIDDILTTFQALLRIGMMEGGVGRQRFGPVNLSDLMDRLVQLYEPVMEDADHRFEANHAAGVFVEGDEDLLIQLFTNLIENAIVHTPAGTTISSTLAVQGLHAIMIISDDGPGVPDSERDKIFRKFYRHDTSRNTPGSGLGLSLVAAIADLHNASYRAASTGKGFALEIMFQISKGHHRPAGEG